MQTNPESAAVEAVAWMDDDGVPWLNQQLAARFSAFAPRPLVPQSALDALRGEVAAERERADKFMWQVRDTCARAEKAERRVADALAEIDKSIKWREYECEELRNAVIKVSTHFEHLRIHEVCIRALNDVRKALTKESS